MAKKAFNLGDYLQGSEMSKSDTDEQIRYIPLDRIVPDPANFYSLDGIEDLAGNIELIGLQQPLRVRPDGADYMIVSGHRRRAACQLIRDGGSDMFERGVPCIVEYGEATPAMRELRMIYANSSTRVLSAAELAKQAERVTELLYQLKEQGVEFPGRMREHVAAACRVSETKIARLTAIRKNLVDAYRLAFDAGRLPETHAYRISQEPKTVQKDLFTYCGLIPCNATAAVLDKVIGQVKRPAEDGGRTVSAPAEDADFERTTAAVDEYLQRRAAEDEEFFEALLIAADSFLKCMGGEYTRQEGIERLKKNFRHAGHLSDEIDWQGSGKGLEVNSLGDRPILRTWTETYDMLCSIALNRAWMAITDAEDDGTMSKSDTGPEWQTGTPPRRGRYLARVDMQSTKPHEQRGDWDGEAWTFYGMKLQDDWSVLGWWPLPREV